MLSKASDPSRTVNAATAAEGTEDTGRYAKALTDERESWADLHAEDLAALDAMLDAREAEVAGKSA